MKTNKWLARQGDVLVEKVDELDAAAEAVKPVGKAFVIALGESSGHRHQVLTGGGKNKLFRRGSVQFLEIGARGGAILAVTTDRGAPIVPPRHESIDLPPGKYRITTQKEWSVDREVRNVID